MTRKKNLKRLIRERQSKTGETYTTARRHVLAKVGRPVPPAPRRGWHPLVKTTKAEAQELVERALEREPLVTHFGMGVFDGGGWEQRPCEELDREQAALRKALLEVAACADWIKEQRSIKTLNRRHTSYGYKHRVEKWIGDRGGPHLYIANGSFIAAAIGLGFDFRPAHPRSPNCYFNFSEKTVKALRSVA